MSHMFEVTIPMQPASKSNSRAIVNRGNRKAVIKSPAARTFVEVASAYMRAAASRLPMFAPTDKLKLFCFVEYDSYRRDLDIEVVKDALQASGVICNDRQIRCVHAEAMDETSDTGCVHVRIVRIGRLPWTPRKEADHE